MIRALFDYNDCVSVCLPKIYGTDEELDEHWGNGDLDAKCTCGQPSEPVQIYTGGRLWWNGTACFRCMAITSPLNADDPDAVDLQVAPE
jgi:hypothetical protein